MSHFDDSVTWLICLTICQPADVRNVMREESRSAGDLASSADAGIIVKQDQ